MVDPLRTVDTGSLVLVAQQAEDFLPLAVVVRDPPLLEAIGGRVAGTFVVGSCGWGRRFVEALPLIHASVDTDSWRSVTLRP